MGDAMKKVRTGDALVVPAQAYNAFIDAARDHRQRQHDQPGATPGPAADSAAVVLLRNDSGDDRGRFDVLGIDGPVIAPGNNLNAFQDRVALRGVVPVDPDHRGRFVVLLEPVASGAIGRAWAGGVCIARVACSAPGCPYGHADIADGGTTSLTATPSGAATILWREAGTGTQWAVLRLGPAPPPVFALDPCPDTPGSTRYVTEDLSDHVDQVIRATVDERIGCYTVRMPTPPELEGVQTVAVTDVTAQASCQACGDSLDCTGDCSGQKKVTGTSTGHATQAEAENAAKAAAVANAEAACGNRGVDICSCPAVATFDDPTWSATATVCYLCCCDDGYRRIEVVDFDAPNAITIDPDACEIVVQTRYECVPDRDCSRGCP